MTLRKSLTLLFIICLAGCVPSLHQLYTAETLAYDPAIAGRWQQDQERWEFVGDPDTPSYELTITDKDKKQSRLTAHLIEVEGRRFFDFYPSDDAELECGEWLKFHILPVHLFFRVEKTDEGLTLAAMDPDKVGELLQEKPNKVKHEIVKDSRVVLTDSPENLQKFLLEGLNIEGFFGEPVELTPVEE